MRTIGQKIRELRIRKKMQSKEIAEMIGVSIAQMSRYENDVVIPPHSRLEKIARIFGVDVTYFYAGEEAAEKAKEEKEEELNLRDRLLILKGFLRAKLSDRDFKEVEKLFPKSEVCPGAQSVPA
ncbi:MAG: hypothetical protein KatS3mg101_1178 [Patescibacteria group bacterium]|nr:MAG: hypothetical protein KatS3mg101_1178 [Patescibacteria group bacterium]